MEFYDASPASGNVKPRCPREYLEAVIHSS